MSDTIIEITEKNFEAEVLKSDTPVMIDFHATWCGPCKDMAPALDAVAEELKGQVKVGKVDIDANRTLATQFRIMSVPTLVIFKGGKVTAFQPGAIKAKTQLAQWIKSSALG